MEGLTGKAFQRWGKYLSRDVDAKVEVATDGGTAGRRGSRTHMQRQWGKVHTVNPRTAGPPGWSRTKRPSEWLAGPQGGVGLPCWCLRKPWWHIWLFQEGMRGDVSGDSTSTISLCKNSESSFRSYGLWPTGSLIVPWWELLLDKATSPHGARWPPGWWNQVEAVWVSVDQVDDVSRCFPTISCSLGSPGKPGVEGGSVIWEKDPWETPWRRRFMNEK